MLNDTGFPIKVFGQRPRCGDDNIHDPVFKIQKDEIVFVPLKNNFYLTDVTQSFNNASTRHNIKKSS
jgi:hypothetical protein